jgi:hypothetical protein
MSPELETLDQLLGGDLSLEVIRKLYPDGEAFRLGVLGLVRNGDVRLVGINGDPVPEWRIRELRSGAISTVELNDLKLSLTPQGARRIE